MSKYRFVFFGDSICVGQGVSIHSGWVTRLSRDIENYVSGHGVSMLVENASVNGNTTRMALERMSYEVQSHGVDVLVVQFGMNDCNYWLSDRGLPRVSPDAFAANLKEIVSRGRTFGAQAIILNTNHPTTRTKEPMAFSDRTYQESNKAYNALIREVARSLGDGVGLCDVETTFEQAIASGQEAGHLVLDDGLHLSLAGHDLYYKAVSGPIMAAVERVISANGHLS